MRSLALLVVMATLAASPPARARLFWQTYGATVASPTGGGCAWNLDSDYFVPRTCDSCRYDLFSPCKTSHSRSPACKYLHPVYCGYCTPYGPCHYRWRDHVYKKYCGCTPLSCTYGPWRLDKCRKHCGPLKHPGCGLGCLAGTAVHPADCAAGVEMNGYAVYAEDVLVNVEPLGGETLGTIAALPRANAGGGASMAGMLSAGGQAAGMPLGMPPMPAAVPLAIPGLPAN